MRFLALPHLPRGRVRTCALSGEAPYILEALARRGIEVVPVDACAALPRPVASHADMLLHPLGKSRIVAAPGQVAAARALKRLGFVVVSPAAPVGNQYPGDIGLNCFAMNRILFCHRQTDRALLEDYRGRKLDVVWVKQGYAKCSTCLVDQRSAITADRGIYQALTGRGVACLLIRPGFIRLPGYDTGFIGGCAGLIGPKQLAFTGDLNSHPDGEAIRNFCAQRGVESISLGPGPLLDIGGILPLLEDSPPPWGKG